VDNVAALGSKEHGGWGQASGRQARLFIWVALDAHTKIIPVLRIGQRKHDDAQLFVHGESLHSARHDNQRRHNNAFCHYSNSGFRLLLKWDWLLLVVTKVGDAIDQFRHKMLIVNRFGKPHAEANLLGFGSYFW
jgi:hypothetical protein